MVVQNNITATNSYRMLHIVSKGLSKVTEKLSSGYKINRAADDAAGLSISEKMRRQIRGMTQASHNAQDGISLVQVADGALNEVHDMLHRMTELAVQAANDTNTEDDRKAMQAEIDQLVEEIDRIGNTTQFNGRYIFKADGGPSSGGNSSQTGIAAIQSAVSDLNGTISGQGTGTITVVMDSGIAEGKSLTIAGKSYTVGASTAKDVYTDAAVDGTDYTINSVASGGGTAASMIANISNASGVLMGASFDNAPASEAEKSAQNNFLAALNNTFESLYTAAYSVVGIRGKVDSNGYSAMIGSDENGAMMFPGALYSTDILKDGNKVGTVNFSFDMSKATSESIIKIKAGTITQATYAAPTQKDVLTASTDIYTSDGTLVVASGGSIDVGSMDLSTLRLKTTIPPMTDADGDGIDDNDPGTISEAKTYELIESELPSGFTKSVSGGKVTYTFAEAGETRQASQRAATVGGQGTGGLYLQVGADAGQDMLVEFEEMNSTVLGITGVKVTSGESASNTIEITQNAVKKISATRSRYGAYQNRLEYTIRNLENSIENTTSAESAIRDTDMEQTMVEFTKSQILQQAGQSMLAQANQANRSVLALLTQ